MILVAMGVCGCGKTTVGRLLAETLGYQFYDADDFHSPENKRKMNQGIPLTDEDRLPWLASLRHQLRECDHAGESAVLACSALRAQFRRDLADGIPDMAFIYLKGSKEVIAERLAVRKDHYMNPNLLDSQFAALEEPEDALIADVSGAPEEIAAGILSRLRLFMQE
jgi:gluconokinase